MKKQIRLIKESFSRLDIALGGREWNEYVAQNTKEEKDHRRFTSQFPCSNGLTLPQAARLFTVRNVVEVISGKPFRPQAEDIFSVRLGWFMAFAIVKLHGPAIRKLFTPAERKAILALDYSKMNA